MSKAPQLTQADLKKAELLKARKAMAERLRLAYVASDINSRARGVALEMQQEQNVRGFWCIAANRSGKSSWGAREVCWWFLEQHPYKKRLPEWGSQPLFIIVAGRTNQIIEEELWNNKMKPLLPPGSYEVAKRDKDGIKLLVNPINGNRIMFLSHNDAATARERVQGYTANVVWLDECPNDSSYISELILRVSATGKVEPGMSLSGFFYATFTPLIEVPEIREIVDGCKFPFKKYVLRLEDNPIYEGWTSEQLDDMVRALCADDIEFRARRRGEWYYASERAFSGYDPHRNRQKLPFEYNASLLHSTIVDPAASGKVGVSLAVLAPQQVPVPHPTKKGEFVLVDQWWIIKSRKLDGVAASLLVRDIEKEFCSPVNIAEDGRICDCAPSGFYKEAHLQGLPYRPYRKKNDKKKESIETVNVAFYNGLLMLADCPETEELHKELLSAKWKENESEIKNSHKYHCADTVRYLWEMKPRRVSASAAPATGSAAIKMAWREEEAARAAAQEKAQKKRLRILGSKILSKRRW